VTKTLQGTALPRGHSRTLLFLLLLPVLLYAVVMIVSVQRRGPLMFARSDLVLLLLTLTYCCAGMWLFACKPSIYLARVLALVYSVLIFGVCGEVAVRLIRPRLQDIPWVPMHAVYVPSADLPGIKGPIEFTVNDLGFRGPSVRLEDVDLRIMCVGASTTECMYQTDKRSWPWQLQDKLAQRLGKAVLVANVGKSGHITLNHDYLLKHYRLAPRFEWVVLLCGQSDMVVMMSVRNYEARTRIFEATTLRNYSGTDSTLAYYRDLALTQWWWEALGKGPIPPGITLDTAGLWVEKERQNRLEALRKNTIKEVPCDELQKALATYKENLDRIVSTCSSQGQRLVVVTQPTIYRKDLPEKLERLTWSYRSDGAFATPVLEQLMDAFNRATIELCKERGVDCIDAAPVLPKDSTSFIDDVHLTDLGCDTVSDLVCDYFADKLRETARH
jgi:GDSL-like Lipase/Acylhydrolase family